MNPEALSWDAPQPFHSESNPVEGGYETRHHSSPECTDRLAPGQTLRFRKVTGLRADTLCPSCTTAVVAASTSSVLVQMKNLAYVLGRPGVRTDKRDAMASKDSIEAMESIHPDFDQLRTLVLAEAKRVTGASLVH